MARTRGLKIVKVERKGFDTFVTARIKLPRSDVDGWGILDFEKAIERIFKENTNGLEDLQLATYNSRSKSLRYGKSIFPERITNR